MVRKLMNFILCLVFLHASIGSPALAADTSDRLNTIGKSKALVAEAYANKHKIEVLLPDGKKVVGKVTEKSEEGFVVSDSKTRATSQLTYAEISSVKKHGLSTAAKVLIGVGVAAGALAITAVALVKGDRCCELGKL